MKLKFDKFLVLGLLILFGVTLLGCGGKTTEQTTTTQGGPSIVGEYLIDITDLGMPLQFYLKIDSDDNFYLSPDRTYQTDKGHGTIGSSGETYMLIYSDSTSEAPKTSTFHIQDNNLHFDANLPYGASNLPASKVDEENPDITYYLVAKTLMYEDYFGEYAGTHTVSAMGSEVVYDYYLKLTEGREFMFYSEYAMSGVEYDYTETGFYDIDEGTVTLHYLDEDVSGSFDEDMNLTIAVKASEMAQREERVLQVATTAACASIYYGYYAEYTGEVLDFEVDIILVLDKFGGYEYTAVNSVSGTVTETGSFTSDGTNLEFTPASATESYAGTIVNYVVEGEFLVDDSSPRTDVKMYCKTVQGTFSADGEDELENQYSALLNLLNDGTFTFIVTDSAEEEIINATGTFAVTRFMFTQLVLTAEDETVYTLVVSEVGLNVNVLVAEEVEVGFILMKEE